MRFLEKLNKIIYTHDHPHMDEWWVIYLIGKILGKIPKIVFLPSNKTLVSLEDGIQVGIGEDHHGKESCSLLNFVSKCAKEGIKIPIPSEVLERLGQIVFEQDTTGSLFKGPPHPGLNILSLPILLKFSKLNYEDMVEILDCIVRALEELLKPEKKEIEIVKMVTQYFIRWLEKSFRFPVKITIENVNSLRMLNGFKFSVKEVIEFLIQNQQQKKVNDRQCFTVLGVVLGGYLLQKSDEEIQKISNLFFDAASRQEEMFKLAENDFQTDRFLIEKGNITICFFTSNSEVADAYARKQIGNRNGIVGIRRSSGNVQFFSIGPQYGFRPDLTKLAAKLRKKEAEKLGEIPDENQLSTTGLYLRWFLHESGKLLLNGSLTSEVPATLLTNKEIIEILKAYNPI